MAAASLPALHIGAAADNNMGLETFFLALPALSCLMGWRNHHLAGSSKKNTGCN
jgi:hypothetical protein